MKRIALTIATLFCFGLIMSDADAARRFGGGASSGIQRNSVMQRQAAPAAPANQAVPAKPAPGVPAAAAPTPAAPTGMARWLGPLAGLALGAGLASLFMGGGGFGGVLMIMLLAAAAFFLFSRLRRAPAPEPQLAHAGAYAGSAEPVTGTAAPMQFDASVAQGGAVAANHPATSVPAGFDVDAFLRQAKLNFMRLQAANDRKDLHDIRNFTTPEMFAEISLQAQERGGEAQEVDVSELNAELLDVTEGSEEHLASVRFFGTLREAPAAAPESFDEVWHLAKPASGKTGWLIAGIQQFA